MTQPSDDEEKAQPTLEGSAESVDRDSGGSYPTEAGAGQKRGVTSGDDVEGGQTTLGEFAGEDPPESDVAALETRLDALEADQEAAVELIEQVAESVERLSDLADGEQHQPPTHTEPRGFY